MEKEDVMKGVNAEKLKVLNSTLEKLEKQFVQKEKRKLYPI